MIDMCLVQSERELSGMQRPVVCVCVESLSVGRFTTRAGPVPVTDLCYV